MWLATLYAVGHATMVILLGVVAILFAERVPGSVDTAMERLVGVSLVALGLWIVWTAATTRGAPPMRSRWMVLLGALRRLVARVRRLDTEVVIEHSHPHDHDREHDHGLHAHPHPHPSTSAEGRHEAGDVLVQHSHTHRHVARMPSDPFMTYTSWSSYGVGVLHGIGAETPTQVLVFAAAAQASDRPSSIGLLLCFVVGLLLSNTLVAAATTFGFRSVLRNRAVSIGLAAVTAVFSLAVGMLLLSGHSAVLPPIFE
jgi:high-affinity nickel permease